MLRFASPAGGRGRRVLRGGEGGAWRCRCL